MTFSPKARFKIGVPLMVPYTPGSAVSAGDVIVSNSIAMIAHGDIAASTLGAVASPSGSASYDIVKGASSFSVNDPVYWDSGNSVATSTSGGNYFLGLANAAAVSGDTTVRVQHLPLTSLTTIRNPISNPITDPGNAGAIPVTVSGYVPLVTGSAHTRTLADPTFIGQELLLYVKTDGGTVVITTASAINQTGNNTITMADVRDSIRLQAIESGSNKVWDVVANNGAALSTV